MRLATQPPVRVWSPGKGSRARAPSQGLCGFGKKTRLWSPSKHNKNNKDSNKRSVRDKNAKQQMPCGSQPFAGPEATHKTRDTTAETGKKKHTHHMSWFV
jgi:hypothetical protein